jgi:predicted RNase H-like nuclease
MTWGIVPKVKEVDDFLGRCPEARSRVREVHPEVCFGAFAGGAMKHRKGIKAGYQERLNHLRRLDPATDSIVDSALREFPRMKVAKDDILDSLVAALTADCSPDRLESLPVEPQWDACGLPMEMLYCHSG